MASCLMKFALLHGAVKLSIRFGRGQRVVHDKTADKPKVVFACAEEVLPSEVWDVSVCAVNYFVRQRLENFVERVLHNRRLLAEPFVVVVHGLVVDGRVHAHQAALGSNNRRPIRRKPRTSVAALIPSQGFSVSPSVRPCTGSLLADLFVSVVLGISRTGADLRQLDCVHPKKQTTTIVSCL